MSIDSLPYVLIQEFAHHMDDETRCKFMTSCKKIHGILDSEMFYKRKCLSTFGQRFRLNINPIYNMAENISWKTKYRLSRHFPLDIHYSRENPENCEEEICPNEGLKVEKTIKDAFLNAKTVEPFITCNLDAVKLAHAKFLMSGLEYFEIKLFKNTIEENIPTAIGISVDLKNSRSCLGWSADSYGYHSDDGTIRHDIACVENIEDYKQWIYSTNDTVGMGLDWDRQIVFATLNGKLICKRLNLIFARFFPSISIGMFSDSVLANFGDTDFMFDISDLAKNPDKYYSRFDKF